jgi:hypothetical protein
MTDLSPTEHQRWITNPFLLFADDDDHAFQIGKTVVLERNRRAYRLGLDLCDIGAGGKTP